jgi:hypothetical protein
MARYGAGAFLASPLFSEQLMLFRTTVVLGVLALWIPGDLYGQQPSFGPLAFEEGGPINRISYTPMMESADVVPVGAITSDVWLGFSNMFEHDSASTHFIFVDMERLITAATVRWGVAEGFEVGGRVTLETRSGGFLDPFLHWYHDILGMGQANRDRYPEEGYRYKLSDGTGNLFIQQDPQSLGLEDVRLFAKWRALSSADARSVLSLRAVTRLPTNENAVGRERADVGVMALARLGVGAWYIHGMFGASTARSAAAIGPALTDKAIFFSLAFERSLGSGIAGIFQYQYTTPALQGFDDRELDWPLSNIIFGVAGSWSDSWSWDVSFQEDMPADAPAIDFTLGARITHRWR